MVVGACATRGLCVFWQKFFPHDFTRREFEHLASSLIFDPLLATAIGTATVIPSSNQAHPDAITGQQRERNSSHSNEHVDNPTAKMNRHHSRDKHRYVVVRSALNGKDEIR